MYKDLNLAINLYRSLETFDLTLTWLKLADNLRALYKLAGE